MSADSKRFLGLSLLAWLIAGSASAQDNGPDLDFLEYLGTWDASDEDWMVISELSPDMPATEPESEPPTVADEESTESNNEP